MKKSEKIRFLHQFSLLLLVTMLSVSFNAFAEESLHQPGAMYITYGHKKMPADVTGTGVTSGVGLKKGGFGMEFYSADMRTTAQGMEPRLLATGTPTGETAIIEKSFGIAYNISASSG